MGGRGSAVDTDPGNLWVPFFVCISIGGRMAADNLCIARTTLFARHMARWRTSECLPITTKTGPVKAVEASRGGVLSFEINPDRARIQQQLSMVGDLWKIAGGGQWTGGFNAGAKGNRWGGHFPRSS